MIRQGQLSMLRIASFDRERSWTAIVSLVYSKNRLRSTSTMPSVTYSTRLDTSSVYIVSYVRLRHSPANAHKVSCRPVHARAQQPCYTNLVHALHSRPARLMASPLRYTTADSNTAFSSCLRSQGRRRCNILWQLAQTSAMSSGLVTSPGDSSLTGMVWCASI